MYLGDVPATYSIMHFELRTHFPLDVAVECKKNEVWILLILCYGTQGSDDAVLHNSV